jgi:cell division protein FtsL
MQKLDKVAEQFNKAIVDMAQKNNELAEIVSKNEQKLTGIEKTNKLLIVLLIVSILVSVVTRMI